MTTNTQFPREGKMRVTPEQSRILQERLFKEGYMWGAKRPLIDYTDKPFLVWDESDMTITYLIDGEDECFIGDVPQSEYQFSDLFPDYKEEPFDIAGGIVDIITILKNTRDAELVKKVLAIIKK